MSPRTVAITPLTPAAAFAKYGVDPTVPNTDINEILETKITTFNLLDPATGAFNAAQTTADETIKAYDAGRCDAFTTDASGLYAERLRLAKSDDHIVLPEIISKEPLGPSVRHGDDQCIERDGSAQWLSDLHGQRHR